jgi:two-component system sensor histidine kinase TctE
MAINIFNRAQRSLFGEILDWMLTPLLLLWPISLVLTWLVAQNIAGKPFDRALAFNAQTMSQLVTVHQGRASFTLSRPAHELLRADSSDTIYFQVLGTHGELLGGTNTLPAPPVAGNQMLGQVQFRDDVVDGIDVKVAYTWVQLPMADSAPALVQVAETLEKRSVLATEIIKGVMLPQFFVLPLAVLLVWLALVQSMKPLSQLETHIRARKSDDLSPIDARLVPLEVAPLVASVNDLLLRLTDSITRQKRFLADAAHQLKTPLAGLRMQADLAQREGASSEDLKQSLRQIGRASIRATHSVNQLLSLARAEASDSAMPHTLCDMAALTLEVVRDCVPRALDKHIDMGFEGMLANGEASFVVGNATLLTEMVRNLVDNAIHYTPSSVHSPGVITVRLLTDNVAQTLALQIEDSGPGVPTAERELIFRPFYRALGTEVDGSGLGLAIVMEIAQRHKASISVEDTNPGNEKPGARFSVHFNTVIPDTFAGAAKTSV